MKPQIYTDEPRIKSDLPICVYPCLSVASFIKLNCSSAYQVPESKSLNYKVLLVFAPVLILTGILGFIIPPEKSPTSGATVYHLFHLVFGAIGWLVLFSRNEFYIRIFNVGFGLIDLYQALASFADIFPQEYFRWTRADDVLHIVIGAALFAVGIYGFRKNSRAVN